MRLFLIAALLVLPSATAEASVLVSNITFDGVEDVLKDASAGNIIDSNSDGTLNAGDILQGIVHFNQIGANFPPQGGSVFAAYSFEVVTSSTTEITVKAATGGNNIRSMLATAGVATGDLVDYKGRKAANVAGLVVLESTTAGISLMDKNGDGTAGDTFDGGDLAANFDSSWSMVLVGGFIDGTDDQHVIKSENGYDINNLAQISGASAREEFGSFAGIYSVLEAAGPLGGSTEYLAVTNNALGSPGNRPSGEIVISNGSLQGFDSGANGSNWGFQDDGDYVINAVPEPSTIAIWAALGLGGCGFAARRRMKAKKA